MGVIAAANLHREGVRTHLSAQVENNVSQKGPICDCSMTKTPTKTLLAASCLFLWTNVFPIFLWDLRLLKFIFHTLERASTCMKSIFIFSIQNIYFKCQSKHRCQHNQQYIAQLKKKKKLISIHQKKCVRLLSGSRCSTETWKRCVHAFKSKHPHTMHMNVHIMVFHELEWLTQK